MEVLNNFYTLIADGETKAYQNGAVDAEHCGGRQFADPFLQPTFVKGADLFQQNYAVFGKSVGGRKFNVGRELGFVDFACDSGGDDGGGIFVADVVLHDEYGANPPLFTAYDGG